MNLLKITLIIVATLSAPLSALADQHETAPQAKGCQFDMMKKERSRMEAQIAQEKAQQSNTAQAAH